MGKENYANARKLLITADGGGSNGSRVRLWKTELQQLADEMNLEISVCHFPPGTRKWNKIEHRMFSFISRNWRGKPLVSIETIINLIGATKTKRVHSQKKVVMWLIQLFSLVGENNSGRGYGAKTVPPSI